MWRMSACASGPGISLVNVPTSSPASGQYSPMTRERLATRQSSASPSDNDGAGGTNASLVPPEFRRFAITPPDGFACSRRAQADPAALRKSAPPQRAARRYRRPSPSGRSDRPIPRLVGPINPDDVAALAQAGQRGPRRVRQPASGGDKFGESRRHRHAAAVR